MAEPGRSLHPSAAAGGGAEPRTLRLLRLLLWVGTAFQVTRGAAPELHACKEVTSFPPDRTRLGDSLDPAGTLGSWVLTLSEATEFGCLGG